MGPLTVLEFAVSCVLAAIFIQQTQAQVTATPVCESTGHRCINTNECNGKTNGQYQWCGGCQYSVRCTNNVGELNEPFNPPYTYWDDNKRNFDLSSATCVECYTPCPPGPSAPTVPVCEKTGLGCLSTSCPGGPAGNFQFCGNCSYYATCLPPPSTVLTLVACGTGTFYDDVSRSCQATSTTCRECYDTCYPPTTVPPTEAATEAGGGPSGSTEGDGDGGGIGSTEGDGDGGGNAGNELRTGLVYCSLISLMFTLYRMLV